MAWRNRPHNANRNAFVTPKMADFLGCNRVTPIPGRERGKAGCFGGVSDRAQLVQLNYTLYICI
jgi:hypothetical protein